jgi:hypothetical protein
VVGQHDYGGCTVTCPVCDNEIVIGALADRIHETVKCPHCEAWLVICETPVEEPSVWQVAWLEVAEQ